MRKKHLSFIIVLGIVVAMAATVPSPKKHRALLKEKCYKVVDKYPGPGKRWLTKRAIDLMVAQSGYQNCFVFSLSYSEDGDSKSREYTSVGMFNHVFLLPGTTLVLNDL